MRGLLLAGSVGAVVVLVGAVLVAVSRRRRAREELDLITSWDAFRAPAQTDETKEVPTVEGNVMDGTDEVQAELDETLE
jgi:hypothetical protein